MLEDILKESRHGVCTGLVVLGGGILDWDSSGGVDRDHDRFSDIVSINPECESTGETRASLVRSKEEEAA